MERLKIVLLTAAIVAIGQVSKAQQSQNGMPQQASGTPSTSYTVIGDIRDPRTLTYPAQGRLSIRAAVLQAQPMGDPVSVCVLRKSQERANWTQMISVDTADSGEFVLPGDVLVVQSVNGVRDAFQKNAAIRTDAGVLVVLLEDEAVAIGDILQQTVGLPNGEQQVTVACRFQGRPPATKTTLASVVSHGDVVSMSRSNRKVLSGFGQMAPSFSEWIADGDTVTVMEPPVPGVPSTQPSNTATESASSAFPLDFGALVEPAEPVESPSMVSDSTNDSDDAFSIPVQEVSQATVSDLTSTVDAASSTETAPTPPTESVAIPGEEVKAGGLNVWNMAVIAGLIVAGILLLAGSLGGDEDMDVIHRQSTAMQDTKTNRSAGGKFQFNSSSDSTNSPTETRTNTAPVTAAVPVTVTSTAPTTNEVVAASNITIAKPGALESASIVKPAEWFGKDWRMATEPVALASKPTVKADASEQRPFEATIEKKTIADTTTPRTMRSSKLDESEAERLEEVVRSIANEGRKAAQTAAAADTTVSASTEFSDLEDLLQDRLPIDLCEAQLPLRINLFGRPAGPRRLRIDAAHPTLTGPHTNLNADRRQDDRIPATASKTESRRIDGLVADEGLDRALNSLQDRTNS